MLYASKYLICVSALDPAFLPVTHGCMVVVGLTPVLVASKVPSIVKSTSDALIYDVFLLPCVSPIFKKSNVLCEIVSPELEGLL